MSVENDRPLNTWLATCAKGLEPLLANEINELGGIVDKQTHMGVIWQGDHDALYKVCLWSRVANRILCKVQESQVANVGQLYDVAYEVDWTSLFAAHHTFKIDFFGRTSFVNNTQFGAQKVKDAVVDRFRRDTGDRPSVDKDADIRIEAHLRQGKLVLYINLSGESLHRRGYRLQPGLAPLKETLAAALLLRANWPQFIEQGTPNLIDPMCGSGTLLIEAGMMAADVAPGLFRTRWGFLAWKGHHHDAWLAIYEQARERRRLGLSRCKMLAYGFDVDKKQIDAARNNLERAGLSHCVHLERRDVEQLRVQKDLAQGRGLIICNPPYGERLSELPQLAPLYQQLHQATLALPNWQLSVFTANLDLAKSVQRPMLKQYRFLNGKIAARLLNFDAADLERAQVTRSAIHGPVEAFANRLKKNLKPLKKRADKEGIYCYRLYDADLPEYAVAIDQYEHWLHVQEYSPPKSIDPAKAERRLLDVLAVLPEVTGIGSERIVLKRRQRQSGKQQYEKHADQHARLAVREGQVQLWVNLHDYLDTGLFLDHRPTRLRLGQMPSKQTFLNLFCYTASASVHAAKAGAICTSVDLSRTYLRWAEDNFELNDLDVTPHTFIQADCLEWLREHKQQYDVIFMDPPTFSNSKRMQDVLDVQRDHVRLIRDALRCLKPDGLLIFSTNLRNFQMDTEQLGADVSIQNISKRSVPFDFTRRANIHHCFEIKHA